MKDPFNPRSARVDSDSDADMKTSPGTSRSLGEENRGEERKILLRAPGEVHGSDEASIRMQLQNLHAEREEEENIATLCKLADKNGMPITQENGQRRYGPPMNQEQYAPPEKGAEVFVGKIPRDCYEPELVPVFEKAGRIYEMRLMMDFSGTNRGYGFVHYYTKEEADRAIRELHNYEIRQGRKIGVTKSVDNCRLFLGSLPRDKSEDELRQEVDQLVEGVVAVQLCYPSNSEKPAYAFVEFASHKDAAMARRKLWTGRLKMWGAEVWADWALPPAEHRDALITSKPARNNTWKTQRSSPSPSRNTLPANPKRKVAPRFQRTAYDRSPGAPWSNDRGSGSPVPRAANSNFYHSVQHHSFCGQGYSPNIPQPQTTGINFAWPQKNPASYSVRPQKIDTNLTSSNYTMGASQYCYGVPGVPPHVYYAQWMQTQYQFPFPTK